VAVLALALGASARLRGAAPRVSAHGVVLARVQEGTFRREVRAAGRLVPEEVRWVTAVTAGRIERILVRPGAQVEEGTILMELTNPDAVVALLQAERELATARRMTLELEARLETQMLEGEGSLATLQAEARDTTTRLRAYTAHEGLIVGGLEQRQTEARAEELKERITLGRRRVHVLADSLRRAGVVHRDELHRREEEVAFRRRQVDALAVRAGASGVLADEPVEPGQWAPPGLVLAQVVRPERLKAELRVAEAQAKDITLGQKVSIDTHTGMTEGNVTRVAASAKDGTVIVEVALSGALPPGARPQLNVEGTVEVDAIPGTVFVERPTYARPDTALPVYRVAEGTHVAERITVTFGRASSRTIEVRGGLRPGDRIVVSDTSAFEEHARVALQGDS
jgi:multidrug resistance efflux pump